MELNEKTIVKVTSNVATQIAKTLKIDIVNGQHPGQDIRRRGSNEGKFVAERKRSCFLHDTKSEEFEREKE